MPLIPFATDSSDGRSVHVDTQRLVNLVPEIARSRNARTVVALHGTPGARQWNDLGSLPVRGWLRVDDALFAVVYDRVLKISAGGGAPVDIGVINTTDGVVSMASNRVDQVMLVDGTDGWIVDASALTLTQITDSSFTATPSPQHVTQLDTFFACQFGATDQWQISDSNDGLTWSAIDFETANKNRDALVNIAARDGYLWAFGTETVEVYYNAGTRFPFARLGQSAIPWGLLAAESLTPFGAQLAGLFRSPDDGDIALMAMSTGGLARLSNPDIETEWGSYATLADARAYAYTMRGSTNLVVNFPSAGKTWALHTESETWSERQWGNGARHRGHLYAFLNGAHLVTDYANGKIWELRDDVHADGAEHQIAVATTSVLNIDDRTLRHAYLHLVLNHGTSALGVGQGSDPEIMLEVSNDGGKTFLPLQFTASIGKLGEYQTRAIWRRLGAARSRVYRASISDPIPREIVGMLTGVTQ